MNGHTIAIRVLTLAFSISLLVETHYSHAQTNIPGGNVSGLWAKANSPYHVNGEITVPDSQTLTIEPRVDIVFTGYYKFNVQGRLLAIGTEKDTITFTAQDTKTGWHGIRFDNTPGTNDSSKIIFCKLQYGKASTGSYYDQCGGAIFVMNFNKLVISHCLINFNSNSGIPDYTGGGAICFWSASPILTNSTISDNNGTTGGGIICWTNANPVISNNIIANNSGYDGGGIYIGISNPLVMNNVIVNNRNTDNGGGIRCHESNAFIVNNTIVNNRSGTGGGIDCYNGSRPIIVNTVIYGNSANNGNQVYIGDANSIPSFYYCDIEGGKDGFKGDGSGANYSGVCDHNIDSDPLFKAPTAGNYRLSDSSPCISAGSDSIKIDTKWYYAPTYDFEGNPRPNPPGTSPDIGAFESKLGGPYVQYLSNVLDDSDGNSNGKADAGETVKLIVTLKNTSLLDATGVSATLTNDDPDVQITHATANFGDLPRDESSSNQNAPFTFSVSPSSVTHLTTFYLNITVVEGGYVYVVSFKILIGTPAILLVDDDKGKTYEVYYTKALEMKQIYSEAWDVSLNGSPTIDVLQRYKSVIWFTGDDRDSTLTAEEQSVIAAFLDGGAKLLITGQDIGFDLVENGSASDSVFYTNHLHAQYIADSSNTTKIRGVLGDPITGSQPLMSFTFGSGFGAAGNQTAPDVISPIAPAETILQYAPRYTTSAALKYENKATGSRLVYLAFGFEGIAGATEESAANLMENILQWLAGQQTPVKENVMESVVPNAYVLSQNFPNPFNPSTRIEFSLPRSSYATLKVFSLLGEEVATLAGQDLTAGSYRVDWNAKGVASGVYLYRLVAGSFVDTKKMLLLR